MSEEKKVLVTTELPEFGELFKLQLEGIEPLTQELYDRLSEAGRDNHIVGEKSVFATLSGSNGTNIVRFMALSKMEDLANKIIASEMQSSPANSSNLSNRIRN